MDAQKYKLNTKWICWYHDPFSKKWSIDSYVQLYKLETILNTAIFKNSLLTILPKLESNMYFVMRQIDDNIIYPVWEDKNNRDGGVWSFKVSNKIVFNVWITLLIYLTGETMLSDSNNYNNINGISISPKKNFSIIKIWTRTKIVVDEFSPDFKKMLSFSDGIYKNHNINIEKDTIKRNQKKKKKYF
tara:strand:+ start:68 stop:628 length:561 start_codon:yes stop_codon:yes gene_type:complete